MEQAAVVQEFLNLMAEGFQILASATSQQLYALKAQNNYSWIDQEVQSQICGTKNQDSAALIRIIRQLLNTAKKQVDQSADLAYAAAICCSMDSLIQYSSVSEMPLCAWEKGRMRVRGVLPTDNRPTVITELNTNWKETGIRLAPKFEVSGALRMEDEEPRSLASSNALYGINKDLVNVIYYPCKDTPIVRHIILPERKCQEGKKQIPTETRIVFSPLTDRRNLLITRDVCYEWEGTSYNGSAVEKISDPTFIENCYQRNWMAACTISPDIIFGPELLATDKMVEVVHDSSKYLKPLLKVATHRGLTPPRITILPTYWKDGSNYAVVFDETGRCLGKQMKQIPYLGKKTGRLEAITPMQQSEVLLIHLINQQRIAISICAEFLVASEYIRNFLCAKLGATLILVPSYSPGEQDFINMLPNFKPYGASVVWGNCCGGVYRPKGQTDGAKWIVGACSFAGIDNPVRFGSVCKCKFRCDSQKSCLFDINIPTQICQLKPHSPQTPEVAHKYEHNLA